MSLFEENIKETIPITARGLVDLHDSLNKEFGHADKDFMYHHGDFQDLDQITEEKIDSVINDILSYIYYYVKLGIDNDHINTFEVSVPAQIFGVTPYNQTNPKTVWLLNVVTDKFKEKGFDCWLLANDNVWRIQWYNVLQMKPNMVI